MDKFLKKSIILGLGIASLTRDKAAELIKEITKEGGITQKEGEKMAKEISDKMAKNRQNIQDEMEKMIKKIMIKLDIPSRKEMAELNKKIDKMQKAADKK
jgi:polyhydroxyalkanoate synthesis regulator phasin